MDKMKFKAFDKIDEKIWKVVSIDFENEMVILLNEYTDEKYERKMEEVVLLQNSEIEEIKNIIKKHDDLKQHVLSKIDEVRNLVKTEQYDILEDLSFVVNCEDEISYCGAENHCINFSTDVDYEKDLIEIIDELISYRKQIKEIECNEKLNKFFS